ncbi:hypothetical protein [Haloarcula limicola]|nr:hypothetical protein [Halomicroarcula limicola]
MSRTEKETDTAKVGATIQELHAGGDIIGLHIRILIEKYAKS